MAVPIRVIVRRGEVVEATHLVHAVAVRDGRIVAQAGDTGLVTFLRSSAKPFQALPLAAAYDDLDSRELAVAAASHLAGSDQLAAVRMLLSRAHAGEHDLECGAEGHPPTRLKHNCSGKHAGMLAVCRAHGWRTEGYRLAAHRMQRTNLEDVARAAELDPDSIPTAVDGCGVVTFALTLERMAAMFTRLEETPAGERVAEAMRAHPEMIRGPGATDTVLMQSVPGAVAKGGAEGCSAGSCRTAPASRSRAPTVPTARSVPRPPRSSRRSARTSRHSRSPHSRTVAANKSARSWPIEKSL